MNKEKLQSAGIDYEDGIRRCAGNEALYEKLMVMFAQDTNYDDALVAYQARNWDDLFSHMHEIKGMSSNLSMSTVYEDAAEIVALLRAQDYDSISPVMDRLAVSYAAALDAING